MESTIRQFINTKNIPTMGISQSKRWAYCFVDEMIENGMVEEEQKKQAREIAFEIVAETSGAKAVEEKRKAFNALQVYKPWEKK